MLQRGRAQLDAGLNALAIEAFRAEIRTNPDAADAYNGLAVSYGRIGRDDLAQRYFETALAKDPGNGKAQANLARLTGNTGPVMQSAEAVVPIIASEPVAVETTAQNDPISELIAIELPSLASSVTAPESNKPSAPPAYMLAKSGVLSTRFAVAPARFVTIAGMARGTPHLAPSKPAELPQWPAPALPSGYLTADYRPTGTRLVRVSLGEVRLVTRSPMPEKTADSNSGFKSFGDRLAVWLPRSIAIEQTRSLNGTAESAILLAAIERAGQGQEHHYPGVAILPELPEFGYVAFDTTDV